MAFITLSIYDDISAFKAVALPLLQHDELLNTTSLSELADIRPGISGMFMGIISCSRCSPAHSCVLLCGGIKGRGCHLYVSADVCCHVAAMIAQQLTTLQCTTLSATVAGAALIKAASGWTLAQEVSLMLYEEQPAEGAMPGITGNAKQHQHQRQQQQQQSPAQPSIRGAAKQHSSTDLQLHCCSVDRRTDTDLTMQWVAKFLMEVFDMPALPPVHQVVAMALPRLQQGLYYVLKAGSEPVCMTSYVPFASRSARITMLYTPEAYRGKGYGRVAVSQLCRRLVEQQYKHICLFADKAKPFVHCLYQNVGFHAVAHKVMLSRPSSSDAIQAADGHS